MNKIEKAKRIIEECSHVNNNYCSIIHDHCPLNVYDRDNECEYLISAKKVLRQFDECQLTVEEIDVLRRCLIGALSNEKAEDIEIKLLKQKKYLET